MQESLQTPSLQVQLCPAPKPTPGPPTLGSPAVPGASTRGSPGTSCEGLGRWGVGEGLGAALGPMLGTHCPPVSEQIGPGLSQVESWMAPPTT